jgi:Fe2+ transport system protein FeoA
MTAPERGMESLRLLDVAPGAVARVLEIDAPASAWRERLQSYGLAPGRSVEVIQHAPVTVVRVDHIDLAFEARIARGIVVSAGGVAQSTLDALRPSSKRSPPLDCSGTLG